MQGQNKKNPAKCQILFRKGVSSMNSYCTALVTVSSTYMYEIQNNYRPEYALQLTI